MLLLASLRMLFWSQEKLQGTEKKEIHWAVLSLGKRLVKDVNQLILHVGLHEVGDYSMILFPTPGSSIEVIPLKQNQNQTKPNNSFSL